MNSLFRKEIPKDEVINVIIENLTKQKLTLNFKDERLKVLNEKDKSKVFDVELSKNKNNIWFLTIRFEKSNQYSKYQFRLFEADLEKNFNFIKNCKLSYFEELQKDKKENQVQNDLEQKNETE